MSLKPIDEWEKPFFSGRIHACPLALQNTFNPWMNNVQKCSHWQGDAPV
ncbi:hypothetical protein PA57_05863 [Pseudomonas aeruginosa]|nr:hypothetical protein PA57_05863 [Pseudomonas aeruginosa]